MDNQKYPRIAIVDIPGKGKGVVALEPIPKGTRIISEPPRIRVPHWQDLRQVPDLSSLPDSDQEFFMTFPCGEGMDDVEGRLRNLIPCTGSQDNAAGLFEFVCRMNHTCFSPEGRPNSVYTWMEERNEEVVHATKDIDANEEITVSYMRPFHHTQNPHEFLLTNYGFACECPGCRRSPAERSQSLARIQAYNRYAHELPRRMSTEITEEAPLAILADIERNILAICEEGYVWELSTCAYDAFQLCCFYGDGASAARWEVIGREVHRVLRGVDSPDYGKSTALVKNPASFRQWRALAPREPRMLRGPNEEVFACFRNAVMPVQPRCSNAQCLSTGTDVPDAKTQKFLRCGPCLGKLGLDVFYCSTDCQKTGWSAGHKGVCGKQVKV